MTSAALADAALDDRLASDGMVELGGPLLDEQGIDQLRRLYLRSGVRHGTGWHSSFNVTDPAYRHEVWDTVAELLADAVTARFVGYRAFNFALLAKWPGPDGLVHPHQDWTCVDPADRSRSFAVFVALGPIDDFNGGIRVVPGSHRLQSEVRGTDLHSAWCEHPGIIRRWSVGTTLRSGGALVWDTDAIHFSDPNLSPSPRLAAAVGMCPTGSEFVHFRREGPTTAAMYRVPPSFFRDADPYRLIEQPPDGERAEEVEVGRLVVSAERLERELVAISDD